MVEQRDQLSTEQTTPDGEMSTVPSTLPSSSRTVVNPGRPVAEAGVSITPISNEPNKAPGSARTPTPFDHHVAQSSSPGPSTPTTTNATVAAGPSAHRGIKLEQIAERQAGSPHASTPQVASAKAQGKRKRGIEEDEIMQRAYTV